MLDFYGVNRDLFPKSDTAAPGSLPTKTPPALWLLKTIVLPPTGYTGDGDYPPTSIKSLTKRPMTLEFTDPASDVPVLATKTLLLLSVADSTRATASCAIRFAAKTWLTALSTPGDLTASARLADLPADSTPVPAAVEARDTTHTMDPEPAVTLHAISFPGTPVPAAQTLMDCQPKNDFSNLSHGSQNFADIPARIFSRLSEEPRQTLWCQPTSRIPSAILDSHSTTHPSSCHRLKVGCSSSMHSP